MASDVILSAGIFLFLLIIKYIIKTNNKMAKTITIAELKKMLKEKNLVIGRERTIKNLKLGKVDKVVVTLNCPEKVQEDIDYYAGLGKAEVLKIKYPNEELGIICKKPFAISVLSILKGTSK